MFWSSGQNFSFGCPISGSAQGEAGWGLEQFGWEIKWDRFLCPESETSAWWFLGPHWPQDTPWDGWEVNPGSGIGAEGPFYPSGMVTRGSMWMLARGRELFYRQRSGNNSPQNVIVQFWLKGWVTKDGHKPGAPREATEVSWDQRGPTMASIDLCRWFCLCLFSPCCWAAPGAFGNVCVGLRLARPCWAPGKDGSFCPGEDVESLSYFLIHGKEILAQLKGQGPPHPPWSQIFPGVRIQRGEKIPPALGYRQDLVPWRTAPEVPPGKMALKKLFGCVLWLSICSPGTLTYVWA